MNILLMSFFVVKFFRWKSFGKKNLKLIFYEIVIKNIVNY